MIDPQISMSLIQILTRVVSPAVMQQSQSFPSRLRQLVFPPNDVCELVARLESLRSLLDDHALLGRIMGVQCKLGFLKEVGKNASRYAE